MKQFEYIYLSILILFTVSVRAQDNNIIADVQYGCDSLYVQFSLENTTDVISAQWNFGNGETFDGITPPVIFYDTVGTYDVSVIINGDASNILLNEDFIGVFPHPPSRFMVNDSILFGSFNIAFTVSPQDPPFDTVQYYYNWDFGDGILFTALSRQHGHRYPNQGEYIVNLSVIDGYGCESSSSDTIYISDLFSVCNIFTPNDDGINDEFVIETNGLFVYSLNIFTRTGTTVYETEGPTLRWDGRNNAGVKMSPGLYYYVVKELNGPRNQIGFFYMKY